MVLRMAFWCYGISPGLKDVLFASLKQFFSTSEQGGISFPTGHIDSLEIAYDFHRYIMVNTASL